VRRIVRTLLEAHKKCIVHGDIAARNLFAVGDEETLVNDWGLSFVVQENGIQSKLRIGKEMSEHCCRIAKAREQGSPGYQDSPRYQDDLHALVRTVIDMFFDIPDFVLSVGMFDEITDLWKQVRQSSWSNLLDLAESCDPQRPESYDAFANELGMAVEFVNTKKYLVSPFSEREREREREKSEKMKWLN
jgi:hypothetical protein